MTSPKKKKEIPGTKEITFKCRFCQQVKPLAEMEVLGRFYPPVVACRDCAKKEQ